MKNNPKYAYICSTAWLHEVGETDVKVYSTPGDVPCLGDSYCYPLRIKIEVVEEYGSGAV